MSPYFTIKSNARRAARKAGVDPEEVYCCPEGWKFPDPPAKLPEVGATVNVPTPGGNMPCEVIGHENGATIIMPKSLPAEPVDNLSGLADGMLDQAAAMHAGGAPGNVPEFVPGPKPIKPRKAVKTPKPAKPAKAAKPVAKRRTGKRDGVGDRVIAAIHGRWTSIDALMKLSGWQRHTLRGYISTRASKDGFTVERKKIDDVSHYRVAA
jgi:hypothetical protein